MGIMKKKNSIFPITNLSLQVVVLLTRMLHPRALHKYVVVAKQNIHNIEIELNKKILLLHATTGRE